MIKSALLIDLDSNGIDFEKFHVERIEVMFPHTPSVSVSVYVHELTTVYPRLSTMSTN